MKHIPSVEVKAAVPCGDDVPSLVEPKKSIFVERLNENADCSTFERRLWQTNGGSSGLFLDVHFADSIFVMVPCDVIDFLVYRVVYMSNRPPIYSNFQA